MRTFENCTGLNVEIPLNIIDNSSKIIWCSSLLEGCTGLTGQAPELWNMPDRWTSPWRYSATFRGCTGLSNWADIPDDWK